GSTDKDRPLMAFLGIHLKSQRDAYMDPRSVYKRTEQAEFILKVRQEIQTKYPGLPVVISGDFNADLHSAQEFHEFWQEGLLDAFEVAPKPVPKSERITHVYFSMSGQ